MVTSDNSGVKSKNIKLTCAFWQTGKFFVFY